MNINLEAEAANAFIIYASHPIHSTLSFLLSFIYNVKVDLSGSSVFIKIRDYGTINKQSSCNPALPALPAVLVVLRIMTTMCN